MRVRVCPSRQQHTPNGRHRPGRLPLTRPWPSGRPAAPSPRTRRAPVGRVPVSGLLPAQLRGQPGWGCRLRTDYIDVWYPHLWDQPNAHRV
jgi:hypothetical protein